MKKIIYSLVIMIAAGSLFTSCIEQVEPLGIQDMRFAKAEYIRALKDLRAADAEYVRAQAAFELARARYKDAQTANLNADTEYQNLLNEYQKLINEARQDTNDFISQEIANRIDSVKKRMELREKEHAAKMVAAEDSLAMAQERLRLTLRNIALYSQSLTPDEQYALMDAVDMYEAAVEATADQTIVVLQAQRTLDSLKMVREVGPDTAYDKSSKAYIGGIAKAKKDIEEKELEQAVVAALLLAVPDSLVYDDVDGWKAQLDALSEDSTAVAYEQYQTKTEMASYYTNYIHDGVTYFNTVASEWIADNERPAWTTTDSSWIAKGEPQKADYPDTPNLQDSIPFTPFAKTKDITTESFNKFAYLLGSYNQASLLSKADPKNPIVKVKMDGSNADTIFIVGPVSQKAKVNNKNLTGMKNFILGAAGTGEKALEYTYDGKKSPAANYGLWGAYDILEREMVTAKKSGKDTTELREAMEEADSIWTAHRQILIDGLAAYEPYAEAIAQYEADVATNGAGATAMVAAIEALRDELAGVDGVADFASFTINDSTAIFDAIVNFAKARENYLEYDPEGQPHDLDYFYYAKSITLGEVDVDSVLFSALSWDDFKAHKYDYSPVDGKTPIEPKQVPSALPTLDKEDGFFNLITQLLGADVAAVFFANVTDPAIKGYPITGDPAVIATKFNNYALYGGQYTVDDYEDPTEILKGGAPYVPSNLTEDKAAIAKAIYAGTPDFGGYVDVYNSFWALSESANMADYTAATTGYYAVVESGADADKIAEAKAKAEETVVKNFAYKADDVKAYTLATFKPYADNAPIVYFTNNTTIDTTEAMKAVLTAVDPAAKSDRANNNHWDGKTFEAAGQSAIFKDGKTDFWNFMKAAYDYYYETNTKLVQDLAVIKEWIDGVESTFTADAARKTSGTAAYNADKKAYDTAVARKPRIEDWRKKLQEFAGEGAWETTDIVTFTAPATAPNDFTSINEVLIGNAVEGLTPFGYYPGEWNENLGGAQLALAEELFPEYPEKIAEWYADIKDSNDELTHYQILIKAAKEAYFAAAKIAGEDVDNAGNWDQLVENYKKANENYRKRLVGIIEKLQGEIETLEERIAKFNQGIPQLDIAIAEAEKDLKVETARLQGYEEALAYAKANLDHLLEYIKSLDANFVVPAFDPTKII